MIYYTSLGLSIVLNAISLILLKSYALANQTDAKQQSILHRLIDSRLIISVIFYGIASIMWLIALLGVDLMVAYPSQALTYVLIGLFTPKLFSEEISQQHWIGMLVIIIGVIVLNI